MGFYRDWIDLMRSQLASWGHPVSSNDGLQVALTYGNYFKKRISQRPRRVEKSREFKCPSELEPGLEAVTTRAEQGKDLTPFLSRLIDVPKLPDGMLNEFGLYHLHLGELRSGEAFADRTGPVLIAAVTPDRFLMIDVREHGSGHKLLWTTSELLDIVNRNWPEVLNPWKAHGFLELEYEFSDEDRAKLRKANINTPIKLDDGSVAMPPGGGTTTSGASVELVLRHHSFADRLRHLEAWLSKHPDYQRKNWSLIGVESDSILIQEESGQRYVVRALADGYEVTDV